MSKLLVISGSNCVSILLKFGFYDRRQKGSHIILRKDIPFHQVVVPNHKILDKEI